MGPPATTRSGVPGCLVSGVPAMCSEAGEAVNVGRAGVELRRDPRPSQVDVSEVTREGCWSNTWFPNLSLHQNCPLVLVKHKCSSVPRIFGCAWPGMELAADVSDVSLGDAHALGPRITL